MRDGVTDSKRQQQVLTPLDSLPLVLLSKFWTKKVAWGERFFALSFSWFSTHFLFLFFSIPSSLFLASSSGQLNWKAFLQVSVFSSFFLIFAHHPYHLIPVWALVSRYNLFFIPWMMKERKGRQLMREIPVKLKELWDEQLAWAEKEEDAVSRHSFGFQFNASLFFVLFLHPNKSWLPILNMALILSLFFFSLFFFFLWETRDRNWMSLWESQVMANDSPSRVININTPDPSFLFQESFLVQADIFLLKSLPHLWHFITLFMSSTEILDKLLCLLSKQGSLYWIWHLEKYHRHTERTRTNNAVRGG